MLMQLGPFCKDWAEIDVPPSLAHVHRLPGLCTSEGATPSAPALIDMRGPFFDKQPGPCLNLFDANRCSEVLHSMLQREEDIHT